MKNSRYSFQCLLSISVVMLLTAMQVAAQKKWSVSAGYGLAYLNGQNRVRTQPSFGVNAGAGLSVPVSGRFSFETGLSLTQKGYRFTTSTEDSSILTRFDGENRFTVVSLPLCIRTNIVRQGDLSFSILAGINYGLLINTTTSFSVNAYRNGQHIGSGNYSGSFRVGLSQSEDENGNQKIDLYLFNPSLLIRPELKFKEKLTFSILYDYALNNMAATGGPGTSLKLRYIGLAAGYIF